MLFSKFKFLGKGKTRQHRKHKKMEKVLLEEKFTSLFKVSSLFSGNKSWVVETFFLSSPSCSSERLDVFLSTGKSGFFCLLSILSPPTSA